MKKIILLDLNSTYAENAMQVHIMRKGIYNVKSEFYRRLKMAWHDTRFDAWN